MRFTIGIVALLAGGMNIERIFHGGVDVYLGSPWMLGFLTTGFIILGVSFVRPKGNSY